MNNRGRKIKSLAMRWRFRLDHARAIFGMLTFALLLAVGYVNILPWFKYQGFWRGEFLLTFLVFIVFAIGGYVYDKLLKLWSEDITVRVERNPYTYMPHPKEHLIGKSMNYVLVCLLQQTGMKEEAKSFKKILDEYYSLTPNTEGYREKSEEIKILTNKFTNKIKEMIEEGEKETFLKIKDFVKEKYSDFFEQKEFFPRDETISISCEIPWCDNDSLGQVSLIITNDLIVYYEINPDCNFDMRCSGCKEWTKTKLVQIQKNLYNIYYPDNKVPLCKRCQRKGLRRTVDEIIELINSTEYDKPEFF